MAESRIFGRLASIRKAGRYAILLALLNPGSPPTRAADEPPAASTPVEEVARQAMRAMKLGQFAQARQLLVQAADSRHDPLLVKLAGWAGDFASQEEASTAQRRQQAGQAIANAKLQSKNGDIASALQTARDAAGLADDFPKFVAQPWVSDLIGKGDTTAADDERRGDWLAARQAYSHLDALQPGVPKWREKLSSSIQRARMVVLYAPQTLIPKRSSVNWERQSRGVESAMIVEALPDLQAYYYRDPRFHDLLLGGLDAVKKLVTLPQMQLAYPTLGDETRRSAFVAAIDEAVLIAKQPARVDQRELPRTVLGKLETANRSTIKLPVEMLWMEFADGVVGRLDPMTRFIWPTQVAEYGEANKPERCGVGIEFSNDPVEAPRITGVAEPGPAFRAGIETGDVVSSVDGASVQSMSGEQVSELVAGKAGTQVALTLGGSHGAIRSYTLKREALHPVDVQGWRTKADGTPDYLIDSAEKLGYLRVSHFNRETKGQLDQAMTELTRLGARGLVLDLRSNPGGLLSSASQVADTFLSDGIIVSSHPDRTTPLAPSVVKAKADPGDCALPLVVLVNQTSAAASEIVSGCFQQLHRALLIGQRTAGSASVQIIFPVGKAAKAYLVVTSAHHFLPDGSPIRSPADAPEWGIRPDVLIAMTPEQTREADAFRREAAGNENKMLSERLLASDTQLAAAALFLRFQINASTNGK